MPSKIFLDNICMSLHTTFRLGGQARQFAQVSTPDELVEAVLEARSVGLSYRVIGEGSNILADDDGVSIAVIAFKNGCSIQLRGDLIIALSSCPLRDLLEFCTENSLSGLENLSGIPGTIGGAIAGNAGAYGCAVADALVSANVLLPGGAIKELSREELCFGYRDSALKRDNCAVISAVFRLARGDRSKISELVQERLADRKAKHPDWKTVATAGSFFKNPTDTCGKRIAAGKLLEEADCKNLSFGKAHTWHCHANIIVADEGATSKDVRALAEEMQRRVLEKFGITLVPEVLYLG